jgi:eukaryotic-like serine/threonine-protein kinase
VASARQVSGAFTAPVVDADADATRPWMATLYIPGEDLGTHVRRHGPLPLPRLRELAAGLSEALRDIHRAGMVHRDLKPANVMLAEDGPRVIDFGISRAAEFAPADVLTQTGRVMGTPPYMSPEQFSSPQDVGPAADVFSLGSVVVYAATGRGPFDSPSPYETAIRVVDGEPELDGVPEELLPFIRLCLEKHPESRPTTDELLAFLRDGRLPDPDSRPRDDTASTTPRPSRRRRLLIASSAGALLLAAATALTVVAVTAEPSPAARDLPAGWHAWQAKDTRGADNSAASAFGSCAVAGNGLICAGDDIKAARFDLATGKVAWSHPVDPTPDDVGGSEGEVLGTRGDRVYVYENNEVPDKKSPDAMIHDYAIQALDARTGTVVWSRRVWRGTDSNAPGTGRGGSPSNTGVVPQGVLTVDPVKTLSYTLLGADTGKPVWRRPMPKGAGMCELRALAGNGYLLCSDAAGEKATVTRVDPATGAPVWTVDLPNSLTLVGQADGRLLFAGNGAEDHRTLTTIDITDHTEHTVRLTHAMAADSTVTLSDGTLFFTTSGGRVQAVDPRTGRRLWDSRSSIEGPGPPLASGTDVFIASPAGRLAALDRRTGKEHAARPGPDGLGVTTGQGVPITHHGDALYVPYGVRSVYSVDARDL